jgi:hypothetical protein
MPLYFAEAAISDVIRAPDDPRLVQVGLLIVDDRGDGSGLLTVPEVPNGHYVVMTYCKPCAPNSAGRVILPLGPFPPFTVVGNSADRSAPVWPWIVGGLLGWVLAAAALVWWFRRRHARSVVGRWSGAGNQILHRAQDIVRTAQDGHVDDALHKLSDLQKKVDELVAMGKITSASRAAAIRNAIQALGQALQTAPWN